MMSKGCGKVVETFGIQDTYQIRQAGVKKSKDILLYTYGNRRIRIPVAFWTKNFGGLYTI